MSRLLIADDHPIFLDGLKQFLIANDHSVMSCARNSGDALTMMEEVRPDVLVLDVNMTEGGGFHVLRTLRGAGSDMPVIFLTVGLKPSETLEAIQLGINGIVLKHSDPTNLLACIEAISAGETWIDPTIIEQALRERINRDSKSILPNSGLTQRQDELVRLVGQGLRNKQIADRLGLTEGTVKVHLHAIYAKLGISSRAQLMALLARQVSANE
jgi:two-component system nitrate/nitrite response regulator NarP